MSIRRDAQINAQSQPSNEEWLDLVAHSAASEASVPEGLLSGYLTMLADAAINGRGPNRSELDDVRMLGRQAAEQGIDARQVCCMRRVRGRRSGPG
jgi:hypothetical protein